MSLQPDGSVSIGLSDRAYVSPKFRAQHFVWSMFNRAKIEYVVESDPTALEQIRNPHFTFHPDSHIHLTANGPGKTHKLFEAIAPVALMLEDQERVPWIRATSGPLSQLRESRPRPGNVPSEELTLRVADETLSVAINVDFVKPRAAQEQDDASTWHIPWHSIGLSIGLAVTYPKIPTLAWFHFE